jgi:hypothetical protein
MKHLGHRVALATLPFLLMTPYGNAQPVQPPTQAEAQAALSPAPAPFTKAQLDQMLAPIALYPDQLLMQVLMAATFPDQLIDAGKWLQDGSNAALKNDDLANALQPLPWDPSVKSLIAFPQIIVMMTAHLDWTEALGAAFANQQVETMSRVQFLRERAMHSGALKSTSQLAVREEESDIVIEPTDPNTIYVPVYNPAEVYGTWPDSDAPPVYIPPSPGLYSGAVGAGIAFGVGFGVVAPLWGWGHPDWRHHQVDVDPDRYRHITPQADITRNRINVEGQVWRRMGPVIRVPDAQRPHPVEEHAQSPVGTIRPSEFARPGVPPAVEHGPPVPPPHPGEPPRPIGAQPGPHPGEVPHPGEPPRPTEAQPGPHPGEVPHPGEPPRPIEAQPGPHPGEVPHPGEPPRPTEAQPGPHPGEMPYPGEPPRPPEARPGPHPGEVPHPGEPPHPPEAPPSANPNEPPHSYGAPPAPHPPEVLHGSEPPHPAEAPHPAPPAPAPPHPPTPPAAPPQAAHPPAPPPQPPHPSGPPPEKKPPPKPGEEQKPEQR